MRGGDAARQQGEGSTSEQAVIQQPETSGEERLAGDLTNGEQAAEEAEMAREQDTEEVEVAREQDAEEAEMAREQGAEGAALQESFTIDVIHEWRLMFLEGTALLKDISVVHVSSLLALLGQMGELPGYAAMTREVSHDLLTQFKPIIADIGAL